MGGKRPGAVEDYEELRELFRHHIESFDHTVESGLETMFLGIKPVVVYPPQKEGNSKAMSNRLLPYECRQARISYSGKFAADICFQYDDGPVIREKINLGQFPIMLKSKLCHLSDADPQKLVSCKEEASEMGGYFILNGLERVVRLLILPKRNY
ncbi:hypothetical protein CRG98_010774, partial [Punica granatum]